MAADGEQPVDVGVAGEPVQQAGGLGALGLVGRGDHLVDHAQVLVGVLPDRAVEGVADDQAADDDGCAQHRAGDDQGGLAAAAVDLAQGEPAGHGATQG
jgi:hypothetical protein